MPVEKKDGETLIPNRRRTYYQGAKRVKTGAKETCSVPERVRRRGLQSATVMEAGWGNMGCRVPGVPRCTP